MCAPSRGMCAPSPSAPLQKAMSVSNYAPYPCVLFSFCVLLPCGIVGCALTWHVHALSVRPSPKSNVGVHLPPLSVRIAVFLPFTTLWDSWVHPHLACARCHLCAPSLGMCAPSLGMGTSSLVRSLTLHVRTLTFARPHLGCAHPHLCAPSLGMCVPSLSAPLQKAMSVSNYHPYPCVLLSFCLLLPCGIVGCALTWHVRALTCAGRHLACARPHFACGHPHLACACPLHPSLSKKQCRCPTTPLIRAYCCLFAFRYLVG